MRKFILVFLMLIVDTILAADFPTKLNCTTCDMDKVTGNFDSFRWKWAGYESQSNKIIMTRAGTPFDLTGYYVAFKVSRPGEGTNQITYLSFSSTLTNMHLLTSNVYVNVLYSNIPPNREYQAELYAWQGVATNFTRTLAQGKVTTIQSLYGGDDSTFPFPYLTNLLAYVPLVDTNYQTCVTGVTVNAAASNIGWATGHRMDIYLDMMTNVSFGQSTSNNAQKLTNKVYITFNTNYPDGAMAGNFLTVSNKVDGLSTSNNVNYLGWNYASDLVVRVGANFVVVSNKADGLTTTNNINFLGWNYASSLVNAVGANFLVASNKIDGLSSSNIVNYLGWNYASDLASRVGANFVTASNKVDDLSTSNNVNYLGWNYASNTALYASNGVVAWNAWSNGYQAVVGNALTNSTVAGGLLTTWRLGQTNGIGLTVVDLTNAIGLGTISNDWWSSVARGLTPTMTNNADFALTNGALNTYNASTSALVVTGNRFIFNLGTNYGASGEPLSLHINGDNAMAATFDAGGQNITNVNTIFSDGAGGVLAGVAGLPSVDWLARKAYDSTGAESLNWSNPELWLTNINHQGNWATNCGDFMQTSNASHYFGPSDMNNSWRVGIVGTNLTVQVRVNGVWTNAVIFTRP